jgi:hypothetical protein
MMQRRVIVSEQAWINAAISRGLQVDFSGTDSDGTPNEYTIGIVSFSESDCEGHAFVTYEEALAEQAKLDADDGKNDARD